jgi:hypothetical protein
VSARPITPDADFDAHSDFNARAARFHGRYAVGREESE